MRHIPRDIRPMRIYPGSHGEKIPFTEEEQGSFRHHYRVITGVEDKPPWQKIHALSRYAITRYVLFICVLHCSADPLQIPSYVHAKYYIFGMLTPNPAFLCSWCRVNFLSTKDSKPTWKEVQKYSVQLHCQQVNMKCPQWSTINQYDTHSTDLYSYVPDRFLQDAKPQLSWTKSKSRYFICINVGHVVSIWCCAHGKFALVPDMKKQKMTWRLCKAWVKLSAKFCVHWRKKNVTIPLQLHL